MNYQRALVRRLMPPPVQVRHSEYSLLFSADDEKHVPNDRLLDTALASIQAARKEEFSSLADRKAPLDLMHTWPGEHYKLLAGMLRVLQPKLVIEVGTAQGLSALAMRQALPAGSRIVTFDILPWTNYPGGSFLKEEDIKDGRITQYLDDLSQEEGFNKHKDLLAESDFLFVDAAKDGSQEDRFIANFRKVKFKTPPIMFFDDIRLWNMLRTWRTLDKPKLDLTSFGHWSGTGLVDWK